MSMDLNSDFIGQLKRSICLQLSGFDSAVIEDALQDALYFYCKTAPQDVRDSMAQTKAWIRKAAIRQAWKIRAKYKREKHLDCCSASDLSDRMRFVMQINDRITLDQCSALLATGGGGKRRNIFELRRTGYKDREISKVLPGHPSVVSIKKTMSRSIAFLKKSDNSMSPFSDE